MKDTENPKRSKKKSCCPWFNTFLFLIQTSHEFHIFLVLMFDHNKISRSIEDSFFDVEHFLSAICKFSIVIPILMPYLRAASTFSRCIASNDNFVKIINIWLVIKVTFSLIKTSQFLSFINSELFHLLVAW